MGVYVEYMWLEMGHRCMIWYCPSMMVYHVYAVYLHVSCDMYVHVVPYGIVYACPMLIVYELVDVVMGYPHRLVLVCMYKWYVSYIVLLIYRPFLLGGIVLIACGIILNTHV